MAVFHNTEGTSFGVPSVLAGQEIIMKSCARLPRPPNVCIAWFRILFYGKFIPILFIPTVFSVLARFIRYSIEKHRIPKSGNPVFLLDLIKRLLENLRINSARPHIVCGVVKTGSGQDVNLRNPVKFDLGNFINFLHDSIPPFQPT